ncbi:hypothetical protein [Sphingobium cupriresistens]|uniref:Uncharacterized protein n=1 Tax=Sphingobium cupriresistens LL01 TaxID=1420583 RepID=A0A0J7Y2M8_9SPHN|nr:hypothetical protein [Sphingobium cupriresistens]KMS57952.1 hypothetical protein V473_07195 [Sphingobium cupriresistens LL01]
MTDAVSALAKLREPFAANHISKLPKPTKAQTEAVRADFKKGVRCKDCGSWHHPDVVHLDYVGHAALTDRLLDTDPLWSWEPVAFRDGLPAFDQTGGLWIKLTVCGVTRLGYGHAASKQGVDPGAREKEVIGDALRNAAMRFGAALDLWHKGDLHGDDAADEKQDSGQSDRQKVERITPAQEIMLEDKMREAGVDPAKFLAPSDVSCARDLPAGHFAAAMKSLNDRITKQSKQQRQQSQSPSADLDDEIPY